MGALRYNRDVARIDRFAVRVYRRNMRVWRYYGDVARIAFTHSVKPGQAFIFLAIIAAGVAAHLVLGTQLDKEGPRILAVVLGLLWRSAW
jgi:hypothetical protein